MKAKRGEGVGSAATLMVFCIFAMLAFTVILLGAGAYRSIAEASRDGSDERLSLSFVWTMVKNNDGAENIYIQDYNGRPSLYIDEEIGGMTYHTIIYYHDGWLMELFADPLFQPRPSDGIRVMLTPPLSFQQHENGGIVATAGETSVYISPRGR